MVLAISILVTKASKKDIVLDYVFCIYYPIQFKKNEVQALIDSGSKVNIMTSIYVSKLGFKVCYTNVKAQKIDSSIFKTFEIVLTIFQIKDKLGITWFF